MFKTILSRPDEWLLPVSGGVGGSVSGGFLAQQGEVIASAFIFCAIGTIGGFFLNKLLQWLWKCITKNKKK